MGAPLMTETERCHMLADYLGGERVHIVARRYRVHISYPAILARRSGVTLRKAEPVRRKIAATLRRRAHG